MRATRHVSVPRIADPSSYKALRASYDHDGEPVRVNFRDLVSWPSYPERGTHLIHPYPAKLLAHIPFFLLAQEELSEAGDRVLDPFCGSGTVLLEGMLAGRNVFGADSNPLARLITRVKTTIYDASTLAQESRRLIDRIETITRDIPEPDVVNLRHWFYPHVTRQLSRIAAGIRRSHDGPTKEFFEVCFSACVRRVSLADPRNAVPVRLNAENFDKHHWLHRATKTRLNRLKRINVLEEFKTIVAANLGRVESVAQSLQVVDSGAGIGTDARRLTAGIGERDIRTQRLRAGSIRLAITSPPYAGAQKYIRSSSLSLGWLGLCRSDELRTLEDSNIGREHFPASAYRTFVPTGIGQADDVLAAVARSNPLRAHIAATYLREMRTVLTELVRVLEPSGHLALIVGNNMVCGRRFRTADYLASIAQELGLERRLVLIDDIRSRGLMTKRNRTADVITQEWVFLLRKPA